jgi:site-specific DNA-cytosine methylase
MTLLTDSAPGGKTTGAIHYDKRRTLTVAERKRLQGVPDKYHICGKVEDVSEQSRDGYAADLCRRIVRLAT